MQYGRITVQVTAGAGVIAVVTGFAVGLGLWLTLLSAAIAASLGWSTVGLVWLLRREALIKHGHRW
jgi:hypothetical protein